MGYLLTLIASLAISQAATPDSKSWAWKIDGSPTEMQLAKGGLYVQSFPKGYSVPARACSKKLIAAFVADFEKKLSANRAPQSLPKDYEPIRLYAPGKPEAKILRGTDFGLYLLNFRSKLEELKRMEKWLCRS